MPFKYWEIGNQLFKSRFLERNALININEERCESRFISNVES